MMGIDHLFVDESHQFKNLMFNTRHDRVAGLGNSEGRDVYKRQVGRVQTPTLGMVCERYWEHKRFESKPFWQVDVYKRQE